MINTIAEALYVKASELNWLNIYAGLVKPIRHDNKTIPVSSLISGSRCLDEGVYNSFFPNDRYASMLYFEPTTDMTRDAVAPLSKKQKTYVYNQGIRIIAWYNIRRLGYNESSISDEIKMDIINHFDGKYTIPGSDLVSQFKLTFETTRDDPRTVFGQYSTIDHDQIFTFPYEFVAADFYLEWMSSANCNFKFSSKNEILCTTL